uniref:MD-2-related lipid-recognition domain-containing protein n=1 Tax=Acrobeloides nanus TaxID=290746 RepID=A0A914D954_9BILA
MVPLFGLLNNLNGCNNGFTCPVQPGNQRLRVYLDFTKYPDVLNWLNNNTSYQMQATLTDKSTGNKVVITDQARIFKP